MPNINRIRVNNVKYNFGTQFYDDFTMRLYGKNTLYDLANGGGKSILMLLLMQNMLPNCTLDEKQPIEKLFRTGNNNTTIHSLVEWKLDEGDTEEGYRYVTTGFCARKAKDAEGDEKNDKAVASVEYFNYCIFYREYNKNDIVNLPLTKDGERITFQGLRTYLKDLEHRDMSLKVKIFDRKGEYKRFISGIGIHESQWEIIRGINKTEGHVRTYFENNYKTTRKVVEDLLIEEIIEKAFMVKTERDGESQDNMARMLMDIKEQLTILARKKKDISAYDHQIELISVLADKVASFMDLYEEQSKLTKLIADICVTGEYYAGQDEEKIEELKNVSEQKRLEKNRQRERIECLKVSRDKRQLEELKSREEIITDKLEKEKMRLAELKKDLDFKESTNEYLEYAEDRKKYQQYETMIKNMMSEGRFDEDLLYTYVHNIKTRMDVVMTDIRCQMETIETGISDARHKKEYNEKLVHEARLSHAVALNSKKTADEEIVSLSEKLSKIRMTMNDIKFTKIDSQLEEVGGYCEKLREKLTECETAITENKNLINDEQLTLSILNEKEEENKKLIDSLKNRETEFKDVSGKIDNIKTVYKAKQTDDLIKVISERITKAVIETGELKKNIDASSKKVKRLEEGRIIDVSKGVDRVIEYIETRHGITSISGMDYLSALDKEKQCKILETNPELPYGVVVKDYQIIRDDPNIYGVDTGDAPVNIYDMESIDDKAVYYGENVFSVHSSKEYLTDDATIEKLIEKENITVEEYREQLKLKEELLTVYREDQEFVLKIADGELLTVGERLKNAVEYSDKLTKEKEESVLKLKNYKGAVSKWQKTHEDTRIKYEKALEDTAKLYTISEIAAMIEKQEDISKESKLQIETLEERIRELTNNSNDDRTYLAQEESKLKALEKRLFDMQAEWDANYKAYYNPDEEFEVINGSDDELKARFKAMLAVGSEDAKAIEDKRAIMDTIKASMEKSLKNIQKRGVSIEKLEDLYYRNLLYYGDSELIDACQKSIDEVKNQIASYESMRNKQNSAIDRLSGSIEYAIKNIQDAFGEYKDEEAGLAEITATLKNGEALLKRLGEETLACEEEYKKYVKQQGYMIELYKDVRRIVSINDISLENAAPIMEDKESLRDLFETNLIKYDKSNKKLDKARNELMKFKGNTAAALDQMEVYELAATIRDDVVIPEDYEEAGLLMDNLKSIVEYISLEKERVSKSLVDMETLKNNFEEQCLQRCLDVKTELDKLPKLSKIMSDGEAIQMVGLSVPYVKEEFLKQRMSDYIDRIVAQTDDYDSDKERIKFIRNSLALKKLFGVIVTDMNAIKLNLYKRERIKEQSRYLRYEEAVGSTGQSQGIYIQFLVSIINYIAGMYQNGNEDIRTKTIFIDNPFGAAKDIYIWEPIFALLKANNVQLIVPARGATPAITGRFDVNYILGQQMSAGKQLTVVTDFTSKVEQDELEYQDLEYEQVSFDFI